MHYVMIKTVITVIKLNLNVIAIQYEVVKYKV